MRQIFLDTETTGLSADNGDRVGVHIINLSPNGVYVGRGADVSATKCLQYLAPSGGFFSLNVLEDFTLATRELYIIATAALSSVSTLEIVAR